MTDSDIANDMRDLILKGSTVIEAGLELGLSRRRALEISKAFGLGGLTRGGHRGFGPGTPGYGDAVARFVQLIESGDTVADARAEAGLSRRAAQAIVKAAGLKTQAGGRATSLTLEKRKKADEMLQEGASIREVSRTLDIPRSTLNTEYKGRGWTASEGGKFGQYLSSQGLRVREGFDNE